MFEITRQGRSNYYVTGGAQHRPLVAVEDCVFGSDLGPCVMNEKETLAQRAPPWYKYVKDPACQGKGPPPCARAGDHQLLRLGYR